MNRALTSLLAPFVAGALFAVGLAVAGMTDPARVTAFLDVTGDWDPALALVMVSAVAVHAGPVRWVLGRGRPLLDDRLHLAPFTRVDGPLLVGAALFGVGWGLGGYCPGPALVGAGAGSFQAVVFAAAMLVGMGAFHAVAPAPGPANAACME